MPKFEDNIFFATLVEASWRCPKMMKVTSAGNITSRYFQIAAIDERKRLAEHWVRLKQAGLNSDQTKRVIYPMEFFHLQLKEEVES